MVRWGMAVVIVAALLPAAVRAVAEDARPTAAEGFRTLVAVTTPEGAVAHPEAWPESLVRRWDGGHASEHVAAWRREGVARLASARVVATRDDGDLAFVQVKLAAAQAEVPLRWRSGTWVLDAPMEWTVSGTALDEANGRKPPHVRLTARTTNGPYGTSAFSFAHITQDPEACLDRMDVWYCHNGDLHAVGDGELLAAGSGRLGKVDRIPLGGAWQHVVHPAKGALYVLHVRRDGKTDFFVRLRVVALTPEAVELEWNLLSLGWGAPRSIQSAQPWTAPDPRTGKPGAEGYAGLCRKNG